MATSAPRAAGKAPAGADETHFDRTYVDERLDKVLAIAKAAGAAQAEALFEGFEGDLVRLGEAQIVQASTLVKGQIQVRIIDEGREGKTWTSDLSDDGLAFAVKGAQTQAQLAPPAKDKVALPEPVAMAFGAEAALAKRALHLPTTRLTAADKARWLGAALDAHRKDGLALAGRFHTGRLTRAVRSSKDVAAYHQGSTCDLTLSALEYPAGHHASSYRARLTARADEALVAQLAEDVRAECHRAKDPIEVETGRWDVVLAPAAMADLLEWLTHIGFSSEFFEDGRSFATGRLGKIITGSAFTLVDDGMMPEGNGVPMPFDAEGTPKQRVVLVDAGIAKNIVHDTRSGHKHGCASTGHAMADPVWPTASSMSTHPIVSAGTQTLDGLVGQVERGLLVTRLHYVNGLLEPRRAVMTGLLRDAAFLIEDGAVKRAVRPMRFTDSILEAFSRIDGPQAISRVREAQMVGYSAERCGLLPYVLVRGLNFTSGR